jgi:hypothetical protein
MSKSETPANVLQGFLKAVHDSLIAPLKANQLKLSYQQELRESKRFQEAENKLREFADAYSFARDNNFTRDNVIDVLRKLQAEREASRMTQFMEKSQMSLQESDAFKEALSPYLALLKHVDEIRRLQTTLMNQGKIKKMPLPYNEITATFTEIAALVAKMPDILTNGLCDNSENLDQVA